MGAIQSAINQGLAMGAAGTLATKHMVEQKKAKQEQQDIRNAELENLKSKREAEGLYKSSNLSKAQMEIRRNRVMTDKEYKHNVKGLYETADAMLESQIDKVDEKLENTKNPSNAELLRLHNDYETLLNMKAQRDKAEKNYMDLKYNDIHPSAKRRLDINDKYKNAMTNRDNSMRKATLERQSKNLYIGKHLIAKYGTPEYEKYMSKGVTK